MMFKERKEEEEIIIHTQNTSFSYNFEINKLNLGEETKKRFFFFLSPSIIFHTNTPPILFC